MIKFSVPGLYYMVSPWGNPGLGKQPGSWRGSLSSPAPRTPPRNCLSPFARTLSRAPTTFALSRQRARARTHWRSLGTEAEKLQHFEPAHNSYAYNKNDDVVRG